MIGNTRLLEDIHDSNRPILCLLDHPGSIIKAHHVEDRYLEAHEVSRINMLRAVP